MDDALQRRLLPVSACCQCSFETHCGVAHTSQSCPDDAPPNLMHPVHNDAGVRIASIGGLSLNISARPQVIPSFPSLTLVLPDWSQSSISPLNVPTAAIRLSTLNRFIDRTVMTPQTFRQQIGLPSWATVILNCIDNDLRLERNWYRWNSIGRAALRLGIDAAIAPAYSTWGTDPPLEQVTNAKRSLCAFAELQGAGIPTVPTIAAYSSAQWSAWTTWLKQNISVETVAVDVGAYAAGRRGVNWRTLLKRISSITGSLDRRLTIVVSGTNTFSRMRDLLEINSDTRFISTTPLYKAINGRDLEGMLRRDWSRTDLARLNMLEMSIRFQAAQAAATIQG